MSAGLEPRDEDPPLTVRLRRRWNGTSRHLWGAALAPLVVASGLGAVLSLTGIELPYAVRRMVLIAVVAALVAFGPRALFAFGRELAAGHHLIRLRRWMRGDLR